MMNITAPPWNLVGNGFILIFKFPRDFVLSNGFIPPFLEKHYQGGFGAVMLVDYHQSDVGPYHELLFIPGLFDYGGSKRYSITKIYVSTIESVVNGQENWGLPKELANFIVDSRPDGSQNITIGRDGQTFLAATFKSNAIKIPINSRIMPLNLSLVQQQHDKTMITRPHATGWVGLGKLVSIAIDDRYFPDFKAIKPLSVIRAHEFKMVFPVPQIQAGKAVV